MDLLADIGHSVGLGTVYYDSPPEELKNAICQDCVGVVYTLGVSSWSFVVA